MTRAPFTALLLIALIGPSGWADLISYWRMK